MQEHEDAPPRDVVALVVLHALLSGRDPSYAQYDPLNAAELAYDFADALKKRSQEPAK